MTSPLLNQRRQSGFVLIMTLFVLAIVGLLLISLANHSMVTATDAKKLRRETERKWSQASCQRFALHHIDEFLQSPEESENQRPLRDNQFTIRLQDTDYRVSISDESARLDVNLVYENSSRVKAAQVIRRMLPANTALQVRLRPNMIDNQDAITRPFEGWGQVFVFNGREMHAIPSEMANATNQLTCWSQKLNIRTCDDTALLESAKLVVGGSVANQLVSARRESPNATVQQLLQSTGATKSQKESLLSLLSDRSWCQSITVGAHRPGYNRTTQLYRRYYTSSIFRIQSYRW